MTYAIPRAAFLFTGQGSPLPGAGLPWRTTSSWRLVAELSDAAGADVAHLLCDASHEDLIGTADAQMAAFALGVVIASALADAGVRVHAVGGHSLGEYTALSAAGVLTASDGATLVAARGAAMARACAATPGSMVALLGVDLDEVDALCAASDDGVWVANDNAPGQIVIAGNPDATDALAAESGARRITPLPVGGAFHTPLMAPAQAALDAALTATTFVAPFAIPFANVDGAAHRDPADWPGLLSAQLCSRVRWADEVRAMAAAGVTTFVEVGAAKVLSALVKRIEPTATRVACAVPDDVAVVAERIEELGRPGR